jgi:CRISPR-associated endonuclease/helicase Cas3
VKEGYWRYWGKADPTLGGFHLAAFHCLDVAAVAEVMLEQNAVLRRRLARWLSMDELQVPTAVASICALHDIGKFDVRFQRKAPVAADALWPATRSIASGEYDHGGWGYQQLLDLRDDAQEFLDERVGVAAMPLLRAVCGHHGALPTTQPPPDPMRLRVRPFRGDDTNARRAWISDCVHFFRAVRGAALPLTVRPGPAAIEVIAGLCSVADWIGSQVEHEGHTYFTYQEQPQPIEDYYPRALAIARRVLDDLPFAARLADDLRFETLFGFAAPRGIQVVTEALPLSSGPSLTIIEDRMGAGKTEAALGLVARLIAAGQASGVYVALPTMATSNGIFARIESFAARLFRGEVNLRLAHGRARDFDPFTRVTRRALRGRSSTSDDEREAEVVCARWFLSRKRALLGQVGVGTVDQAMQAAIKLRHHFVRLYGLAQSVVVIDEVHAYDVYMEVILERLIEWLGALDAPVVLLSATLPEARKAMLCEAYARGAGWSPVSPWRAEIAYPLVTRRDAEGLLMRTPDEVERDRSIVLQRIESDDPESAVLSALEAAVTRGALVCWIRNTVAEAQTAFDAITEGVSALLFHARMRPADREAVEAEVLANFGKQGARRPMLLVATQVVEQSLDLDFDLLVTDLCPIDLILQRAGRLWRHVRPLRTEHTGLTEAVIRVVAPTADRRAALKFGPSAWVYDAVTLALAWGSLEGRERVALPSEIRRLVEDSYDPLRRRRRIDEAPNAEALRAAQEALEGDLATRRGNAAKVCIPAVSAADEALLGLHHDDDDSVRALTRDGESRQFLLVLWEADSEAGESLDGEVWPLDADAPDAWRCARALHREIVSVHRGPWESDEEGARPRGEVADWEAWSTRCRAFLEAMGMGDVVVVPMRAAGDGRFRGSVRSETGRVRRLDYTRRRGLSFVKKEAQ